MLQPDNNFYTKINLDLKDIDVSKIKGDLRESYDDNVLNYEIKDIEYLNSKISNQIEFGVPPDSVMYTEIGKEGTYPHYDLNSVSLNYYIKAGQARLWWFAPTQSKSKVEHSDSNLTVSYRFELENLTPIDYIEPQDNECYLLNTKVIHTVEKLIPEFPRYLIRWVWLNVRYDIVIRRIELK